MAEGKKTFHVTVTQDGKPAVEYETDQGFCVIRTNDHVDVLFMSNANFCDTVKFYLDVKQAAAELSLSRALSEGLRG